MLSQNMSLINFFRYMDIYYSASIWIYISQVLTKVFQQEIPITCFLVHLSRNGMIHIYIYIYILKVKILINV